MFIEINTHRGVLRGYATQVMLDYYVAILQGKLVAIHWHNDQWNYDQELCDLLNTPEPLNKM